MTTVAKALFVVAHKTYRCNNTFWNKHGMCTIKPLRSSVWKCSYIRALLKIQSVALVWIWMERVTRYTLFSTKNSYTSCDHVDILQSLVSMKDNVLGPTFGHTVWVQRVRGSTGVDVAHEAGLVMCIQVHKSKRLSIYIPHIYNNI